MSEQSEQQTQQEAVVSVELVGGPDDWHGRTTQAHRTELEGDREALGTMLISSHTPPRQEWEDIDPRAHYSPDPPPAPVAVWFFRGWVPGGLDFVRPSPGEHREAAVAVDGRGVPLGWTLAGDSEPWRVDRVWAHWVYEGEGQRGTDLGVWQLHAHSPSAGERWELVHDPGAGGWSAAPVPVGG